MNRRKWLIGTGLVALVGVLVWANLRQSSSVPAAGTDGPKNAPQVKVVRLAKQDLTQRVLAPGTLEASSPRELRAPFSSPKVSLKVGIGDKVAAGQILAELDAADLQAQAASQVAQVARAEASVAQYHQQRETNPLQLAQKLESARAQLAQAQQALDNALKQNDSARSRLEQARVSLLGVQSRAGRPGEEIAARQKLQQAEAEYRANPTNAAAAKAYESARLSYEEALRRSAEAAQQLTVELGQAQEGLRQAELDLAGSGDNSAAVVQARSQLNSATIAFDLAKREAETGGLLAEQMRAAEADLAAARAALAGIQAKLEQSVVKAPAAGTVLSVELKDGQPANQGQLLLQLGGLDPLIVKARVDEIDIGKVKPGQALTIRSNAYSQERFTGKVTRVAAQATTVPGQSGTYYEVHGEVQNPESKLRSGMSAEARMTTETKHGVFVVGLESLREENGNTYVLAVKDFKVQLKAVKLGLTTQTQVEILDGLAEGDQVIVSPFTLIRTLKEGAAVRVEVTEPVNRGDAE